MKKAQNMPYQSRTLGAEAWYRFKKNKLALGALAIFILLALMAITTIIIDLVTHNSFYDKYVISQDLLQRLQPPSKEHILGMDEFGRDILLRIIWGTRYSLFMGAFAVLGASVLGGIIGAVAGYYNMMDTILMRIMDISSQFRRRCWLWRSSQQWVPASSMSFLPLPSPRRRPSHASFAHRY